MSSDFEFTMTAPSLLKAAELYRACPTFHTERDGSRHRCSECDQSEAAHVIVALRTALGAATKLLPLAINYTSHEGCVLTRNTNGSVLVEVTLNQPQPGDGENDWDEEHRRKPKLTATERQQGRVDEGREDWLPDREDR